MKKAKIALAAVVLMATFGGALAAKAKKAFAGTTLFYTTVANQVANATITHATVVEDVNVPTLRAYWTTLDATIPPVGNYAYLPKLAH
jgi:hypothetical protein